MCSSLIRLGLCQGYKQPLSNRFLSSPPSPMDGIIRTVSAEKHMGHTDEDSRWRTLRFNVNEGGQPNPAEVAKDGQAFYWQPVFFVFLISCTSLAFYILSSGCWMVSWIRDCLVYYLAESGPFRQKRTAGREGVYLKRQSHAAKYTALCQRFAVVGIKMAERSGKRFNEGVWGIKVSKPRAWGNLLRSHEQKASLFLWVNCLQATWYAHLKPVSCAIMPL